MDKPLLEIKDLTITAVNSGKQHRLVHHVNLSVAEGSICVLAGNSGCGKSLLASVIAGIPAENLYIEGSVRYCGRELLVLSEKQRNNIRGSEIGIVMQNCAGSLDPLMKNGKHLELILRSHGMSKRAAKKMALEALRQVRLENPEQVMKQHPHQLSGGMKQRLMTAIGMCTSPRFLIMDEPTKGMDLVLRNYIAEMIFRLHRDTGVTILLISHDLEVADKLSDDCYVMSNGEIASHGKTTQLFTGGQKSNTVGLLEAEREMNGYFAGNGHRVESCWS